MWPYAWPVPGKLRQWAGSSLCNTSPKRFRGRFKRRYGLRLWLRFRLGQRSRPGPGFRGRLRRYGFWLWLRFRRGRRPRPGFRRLRPWSGRRPRRRFRVRRPRHWRPLRLRDRRRLYWFGACRFRPCRFRLAGIVGYVARMNCGSAGEICCHPGILPGRAVTIRAAAASGQVACTRPWGCPVLCATAAWALAARCSSQTCRAARLVTVYRPGQACRADRLGRRGATCARSCATGRCPAPWGA